MFNKEDIINANKFLKVLDKESKLHSKTDLVYAVNEEYIAIAKDNYKAILKEENNFFIVKNEFKEKTNEFKEKDFTDGLVRMRFELIRYLNPKAFEGYF